MPAALSKVVEHQIADALAQGHTGQLIAKQLGICADTVSRKKKALKATIEALSVHYFEQAAPITVDSTLKALKTSNDILTHAQTLPIDERVDFLARAKDTLAVTDKKEARVLVSMGISPSPAQSIFVGQLNIAGQQTILSPTITDLFAGVSCGDDDVIDVDCRESVSGSVGNDGLSPDNLSCQLDDE
jgi:hypothetical protein